MKNPTTLITRSDLQRLRSLLTRLRDTGRSRLDNIAALIDRLRCSQAVSSSEIPRNVVTLNSQVALKDLDSRRRLVCTLVDPYDATQFGKKLSVAGPAGIALLGKRVGQIIHWKLGANLRRFRIERMLYQPEAAGHFQLPY